MMHPSEFRDRLTQYCYQGDKEKDAVALLDYALEAMMQAEPLLEKIDTAAKEGILSKELLKELAFEDMLQLAKQKNIITEEEVASLIVFERLRKKVIAVDEFSNEQLKGIR
jgi:acyl-CoA dehydrogenase